MTYQSTVAQLYALGHELASTPAHKFDLTYVREMLDALGHPERRFASVLIAGTNGKGSTAATLSSILRVAGYKTALYSSPHLVRINERIRVNGEAISDAEFGEMHDRVERTAQGLLRFGKLPWHPSFFEMLTVMAFEYFASVGVEIAVLEVGMGGRLDATNVVEPMISVIADIALDHQKYLGDTITEIACEKAGIIRQNGIVVTLPQHPQANDVIGHAILEKNARGVSAVKYVLPVSPGAVAYLAGGAVRVPGPSRYPLIVMGEEIDVDSPLAGRHQLRNLALAIATAEELAEFGFKVTPKQMERGIRETHWPGRFQVLPPSAATHHREMVLDVAHNPAGAWALRSALSENFPGRELTLVFAAMRDKAVQEMAEILFPIAEQAIVTKVANPRAATTSELLQAASRTGTRLCEEQTVATALARAREISKPQGVIVVTGSIFLVGEAMSAMGISA
ncbi:MAG TPA: folylpolyglutamate synthase/dihydrofolate synthase family protein [Candidatus Limnocylindrales bacterium]|nr:folylpolyglutamate synthase/dihydrofolate synthase family protein [Candidatus Limnocylindrales bacterium]